MIPLATLFDEYIDRPKLTEQKPFEYIVPHAPPPQVVGQICFINKHWTLRFAQFNFELSCTCHFHAQWLRSDEIILTKFLTVDRFWRGSVARWSD